MCSWFHVYGSSSSQRHTHQYSETVNNQAQPSVCSTKLNCCTAAVCAQVALVGLFIAATAANGRPAGRRAYAARAFVTLAVAAVATDALQQMQRWQLQTTPASPPEAGGVGGGGMAALSAILSDKVAEGVSCDAEGADQAACTTVSQIDR